ncbi:cell division initiation protein [Streptomyces sp. AN091965]|uniref:cell division initiation protein n=1 Tax=Streptomyces sp. AN091965 TaxID=2927803 RepID=UPI001F611DCB|nr:cell division initiation protein [Streptomyces sp. AN091965]MCI3933323.1 cell division initiation protein [Streptomyces sp. AN091965]
MDVQKKIDEIAEAVGSAKSMPMSASCVVNRAQLLSLLEEVRQALPGSLAQAQELIGGREQLVERARQEADRIIESAHAERGSLISDTEVARRSQGEADRIVTEARRDAEEIRAEADDYVDSKLANFEVVLTKTLGSVGRGREKLLGTGPGLDEHGFADEDAPERSHDPETLRRDADAYVDAKLGAFEAVLAKTLEAVGRGRQKLQGRAPADELSELGAHADAERAGRTGHTSDADYLADLAETPEPPRTGSAPAASGAPSAPRVPAQEPYAPPRPDHQPDPYAYDQQGQYGRQDQYGGQDPYAYQQPYGQQDPYGYPQDPYAYQRQEYAPQQAQGYGQQGQAPAVLDETSLFDTTMISAEQLRQYEQGR